jgi:type II secretory pathway component PulJ
MHGFAGADAAKAMRVLRRMIAFLERHVTHAGLFNGSENYRRLA